MYGYYYDPTYILVLIGLIITLGAQALVNGNYNKYKKVTNNSNYCFFCFIHIIVI